MTQKIYVGNMSFDTTEERLQELFGAHGQVVSVNVITDRATGRPRGFAFVEMADDAAAQAAIAALNGQNIDGRQLTVAVAKPMERSADRGGAGGRDRGGDRGGRDRRW
jgi:cold-inducible RNA-binding protein